MAYNWNKLEFKNYWMKKHYSKRSRTNKKYVVIHHATVVGNGGKSYAGLKTIYNIWQTRRASAHYGVDGGLVAQYVPDRDYAWATGNTAGNEYGISIEHCNSTAGPGWKVATKTWKTGAKLTAYIHKRYGMGRPSRKTVKMHKDFYNTACPGPFLSKKLKAYIKESQKVYDAITGSKPPKKKKSKPKKASNKPKASSKKAGKYKVTTNRLPLNGRSGPGTGYRVTMTAAKGYVLSITETKGGWAKSTGGHWYSMKYLKKVSSKRTKNTGKGKYRVVTKRLPLNGRSGPGTGYRVTMTAAKGYILNVTQTKGGWAKSTGGHWYSMKYLKKV